MPDDALTGRLVITWPKPSSDRAVLSALTTLTDADTGQPITSVTDMAVHVDPRGLVTADLTMFCDEAGQPLLDPEATPARAEDGESIRTGHFRWLVTEMRTPTDTTLSVNVDGSVLTEQQLLDIVERGLALRAARRESPYVNYRR